MALSLGLSEVGQLRCTLAPLIKNFKIVDELVGNSLAEMSGDFIRAVVSEPNGELYHVGE